MSRSYEVQGEIHSKGETTSYGDNGFTKREFVIKVTGDDVNAQYPDYLKIELIKDKCALIDQFDIGQELKMQINLGGRLWTGNGKPETCFVSLQAWKVEAIGNMAPTQDQPQSYGNPHTPAPQIPQFDPTDDSDEIPFACCAI